MSRASRVNDPSTSGRRRSRWASGWVRGLVVVLCLGLGLAAGAAYFMNAPKTWEATTTVLVLPTSTGIDLASAGTRGATEINMDTEAELARSLSIAAAASELTGGDLTVGQLTGSSEVTVPTNSQVLEFTVQAGSAQLAADGANALAEAYLTRRSDEASADIDRAKELLQARLDVAKGDRDDLTNPPPTDQSSKLTEAQLAEVNATIADINRQLVALNVGTTEGGQVITEAVPPNQPVAPKLALSLIAGLVAGGALAAALLLLIALRRQTPEQPLGPTGHREVKVLASVGVLPTDAGPGLDEADLRRTCREIASLPGDPGPIALVGGRDPVTGTRVALQLGRAWAAEFGESVVVATDRAARDILPAETRERPGVVDLLLDGVAPGECATRLPSSTAIVVGPGTRHEIPDTVRRHHLTGVWDALDHEFGAVLASATEYNSPLGAMTIQTAGRVIGVVHADHMRDRDLHTIFDALDSLAATERLVGVIVVDDRGPGEPLPASEPSEPLRVTNDVEPSTHDHPLTTGLGSRP